ncbi:MAG: hypothetical protein HPY44_11135 [Armatimonadetes bacterium]|nr:hypothetical protein [Armatimonadota bacterium]
MSRSWKAVLAAAAIFVMAAVLGTAARSFVAGSSQAAYADPPARYSAGADLGVTVWPEMLGGREVATIVVNGVAVMRMRQKYGSWSPSDRAKMVADRLRPLLAQGLQPSDIRSARSRGSYVVRARGVDLVTVMPFDAQLVDSSRAELAEAWAKNLRIAMRRNATVTGGVGTIEGVNYQEADGQYSGYPSTPSAEWRPPERYDDRYVPIVSVLSGFKLGVARVNGPVSKLQHVQAVAQLETHWKDILEIDIFVPISTEVPGKTLDRVEGCAVTGFVDYDF